jgi:HAE1 family hydrophobic/amphiphilic exporter-1
VIDLSVRRPVATAALYVALLALGVYSFRLIPVELLPEVDHPQLTVRATWRGASPESMEALVTAPLESEAQKVDGVRRIRSVSRAQPRGAGSRAEITVEFDRKTRMDFARLQLRERIAAVRQELPAGVVPSVEPYVPDEFAEQNRPFLSYRFHGPQTFDRLAELASTEVRPELLGLDGVSDARVLGGRERVVSVVLDRQRLRALGLRAGQIRSRLDGLSELRAPGSVELEGRRVSLAVRTRAESVAEVRELVVAERAGGAIRLADVAEVTETTAEPRSLHRIDGRPAVSLNVYRQAGTNAVDLADRIRRRAEGLTDALPANLAMELDHDRSEEIRAQLTDLRLRALAAAAVIFLVLMIFLRSLGSVLVVFATIGFSVLAAVNLLYLGGFSLNTLTMAGLAWGFGLVVDNAIVVLENVERRRSRGEGRLDAARHGARQVALPVVAATATTAIVLLPFLFLQGELRVWYVPLGWAVGFSIVASLFVAFTFVPSMAARLGGDDGSASGEDGRSGAPDGDGPNPDPDRPDVPAAGEADGVRTGDRAPPAALAPPDPDADPPVYVRAYRAVLDAALDHPVVVVVVCAASLAGSWLLFDEHVTRGVRWSDMWGQDTYIRIQMDFPRGAGLERTDELARSFEEKLATLPDVERYETRVRPSYGFIRVTFPPEVETTSVPVAIKEQMVAYSHRFSGADVRVYGYGPSFYGGGGSAPNYRVGIYGFNYLKVREIAHSLARNLEEFSRIRDVDPDASGRWYRDEEEFEFFVLPDRERLAGTGLSVQDLLWQVSASVSGPSATGRRVYLGGRELPLSLKMEGYDEFGFRDLRDLRIRSGPRRDVRVGDAAEVERRTVLSRIVRENQEYQRTVAWEFRGPRKLGDVVRDAVLDNLELPAGYRFEVEDRFRWSEEEQRQVWLAVAFAVLLVFMVTATVLESLAGPFVILLTLPLALIGVFLVFFYTGATFTRTAYIGAVMMAGIVVNNAILIVYHIGELREHLPTREAILRGTLERVRPILMTTLTTVLGLLPLILFASSQDENVWNALVLATVGGLLSSTIFVLVAVPVAYRHLVAGRGAR